VTVKKSAFASAFLGLVALLASDAVCAMESVSASGWSLTDKLPIGDGCAARRGGEEVDTLVVLNRAGQVILIAAKPEWRMSGEHEINVRIDDYVMEHVKVNAFVNLVLLMIKDDQVLSRLLVAKDLYWTMPKGVLHAQISGLGEVVEQLRVCEKAKTG
jgi:hypothetical protein